MTEALQGCSHLSNATCTHFSMMNACFSYTKLPRGGHNYCLQVSCNGLSGAGLSQTPGRQSPAAARAFPGPGRPGRERWPARRKTVLEHAGLAPAAPGHVQPGHRASPQTLTNSRACTGPGNAGGRAGGVGGGGRPLGPATHMCVCVWWGGHREMAPICSRELRARAAAWWEEGATKGQLGPPVIREEGSRGLWAHSGLRVLVGERGSLQEPMGQRRELGAHTRNTALVGVVG